MGQHVIYSEGWRSPWFNVRLGRHRRVRRADEIRVTYLEVGGSKVECEILACTKSVVCAAVTTSEQKRASRISSFGLLLFELRLLLSPPPLLLLWVLHRTMSGWLKKSPEGHLRRVAGADAPLSFPGRSGVVCGPVHGSVTDKERCTQRGIFPFTPSSVLSPPHLLSYPLELSEPLNFDWILGLTTDDKGWHLQVSHYIFLTPIRLSHRLLAWAGGIRAEYKNFCINVKS